MSKVQVLKVGVPDVRFKHFTPQEETQGCEFPPNFRLPCRGGDSGDTVCLILSYPLGVGFFLFDQYVGVTQLVFEFFQWNLFYM